MARLAQQCGEIRILRRQDKLSAFCAPTTRQLLQSVFGEEAMAQTY